VARPVPANGSDRDIALLAHVIATIERRLGWRPPASSRRRRLNAKARIDAVSAAMARTNHFQLRLPRTSKDCRR
jgi:hypothetical protein